MPVAENIVDGESEASLLLAANRTASIGNGGSRNLWYSKGRCFACRAGNVDVVQEFLDRGADVNLSDKELGGARITQRRPRRCGAAVAGERCQG